MGLTLAVTSREQREPRSGAPRSSTATAAASSPKDSGWIGVDLIKQVGEAGGRRQRLIDVPAEVAVLTVKPPSSLRAHVRELRHDHFLPVMWRPKSRPFLVQNHRVALDSVSNTHLRADSRRNPLCAVGRQMLLDVRLLYLSQRQVVFSGCNCPRLANARLSGRRTTMCGVATRVSCAGPLQPLVGQLTASGARTPYNPSTAHRISVPGTALLCV